MNLMNLVRLCGLVAIAWTLLAMGAGMYGINESPSDDVNYFVAEPARHAAIAVSAPEQPGHVEYRLVDRSTGRTEPFPLPDNERWRCVSVSPWCDQDGNLEVVGRWNRLDPAEGKPFAGWDFSANGTRKSFNRIELDVFPTGSPCWVPDRPGDFLFPGADGRLHRCHLTRGEDADQKVLFARASRRDLRGRAHSSRSSGSAPSRGPAEPL